MDDTEQPEAVVEPVSAPVEAPASNVVIVTCDRLPLESGMVFVRGQTMTVGEDLSEQAAANYLAAERIARV